MEHAVFRAGRASDAGPGCITRWLPAALAREARRIRAIADERSTTPCGVMFEESDSVVEKLIEGIRPHPYYTGPTRRADARRLPSGLSGVKGDRFRVSASVRPSTHDARQRQAKAARVCRLQSGSRKMSVGRAKAAARGARRGSDEGRCQFVGSAARAPGSDHLTERACASSFY
ncbi:hypothetical protein HPB47_001890 [Ixodes persulcatus]|uniref:Uncharacterized protein n=1 Tax=Ixodes persulcatus TaxID=34615 RepID=A0AC60PNL7_IXOPE|nr:hypothetical protein HPB47_001890 [Ixodes persulcatus]